MSSRDWIQGYSGGKVHPLRPDPSEFSIRDIARALSMLCRYNGHVEKFYSVAEHSVHVSRVVEARGAGVQVCRLALLHDASEAYLADIPTPLKRAPEFAPYRDAEAWLQAAILRWANLPLIEPQMVRRADAEVLGHEARQLKAPLHPEWDPPPPAPELEGVRLGLPPWEAEQLFLRRYHALFAEGETTL